MIEMSDKEISFFDSNKQLWNKKTSVHKSSELYDLEGFKAGRNVLNSIELDALGDVNGKTILHLQCHFGLDTMSWARLGAKVAGVDFSDNAVNTAREINEQVGLDAEFICSNVYDLKEHLDRKFDIVFTSYGVIGWLPDLDRWADIVDHFLAPGGTFYMAEFHPVLWMLDDNFEQLHYSYFNQGVIEIDVEGTYADREAEISHKEYSWNHSLSEVVTALRNRGLNLEQLQEFNYSPYNCFPNTVESEAGGYYIKGLEKVLPMVYSVLATKDA